MGWLRTLIHLHTDYSFDSDLSLEGLCRFVRRERFDCVAVTDHDTIEGARRLAQAADFRVIVGEEISTRDGHLIGLFLRSTIRPGMSARVTADAIHDQGGLVLAPHPFVRLFGCSLNDAAWRIADQIDAVEVCNGQNLRSRPDQQAEEFARRFALPMYCGSDTHLANSIAPCHQIMPDFTDPVSFLSSLSRATLVRGRHPISYFVTSAVRTARYYIGLPMPKGCGSNATSDHHSQRSGRPALAPAN